MKNRDQVSVAVVSWWRMTVRRHRSAVAPTLAAGGLLLLIIAQRGIRPPRPSLTTACVLVVGLAAWGVALVLMAQNRAEADAPAIQDRAFRRLPFALALGMATVAWFGSADGVYTLANVVAWIGAVVTWCWAWWPRARHDRSLSAPWLEEFSRRHLWSLLALVCIVGIGAFFRFYQLADTPADPTSDHAEKLLDIHDVENGEHPIFFVRNTGREPAQFYFTYGLMKVLGLPLSFETLKLGTALIGLLAIPAVFLFAQEVAGRAAGLFAAGLFGVSTWPVSTARLGLRFPYAPLATALALWLLFRYARRGDRRDALACGVVIGFGLHGYTSFRVVPLLVPLLLGLAVLYRRRSNRAVLPAPIADGGLILATALLACLPLARYTLDHPDLVFYRARTRVASDLGWAE